MDQTMAHGEPQTSGKIYSYRGEGGPARATYTSPAATNGPLGTTDPLEGSTVMRS
jgi:hypothetical protein